MVTIDEIVPVPVPEATSPAVSGGVDDDQGPDLDDDTVGPGAPGVAPLAPPAPQPTPTYSNDDDDHDDDDADDHSEEDHPEDEDEHELEVEDD
mgnify:FL=1